MCMNEAGEIKRMTSFELETLVNSRLLQAEVSQYRHQARLASRNVLSAMRLLQKMDYYFGLVKIKPGDGKGFRDMKDGAGEKDSPDRGKHRLGAKYSAFIFGNSLS